MAENKIYTDTDEMFADLEDSYNKPINRIRRVFYRISRMPGNAKRSIQNRYQRSKNGFGKQDVWSFDTYIIPVIGHGLKKLAEENVGVSGGYGGEGLTVNERAEIYVRDLNYHANVLIEYGELDYIGGEGEVIKQTRESLQWFTDNFEGCWV